MDGVFLAEQHQMYSSFNAIIQQTPWVRCIEEITSKPVLAKRTRTQSIPDTLAPPTNASRFECRDSQILVIYRNILCDVTKYILLSWFFFGEKYDLKRL